MRRAAATVPGSLSSSYFSAHNPAYLSRDRHTTFMELYPPGPGTLNTNSGAVAIRAAAASRLPAGITVDVTGHDPPEEASTHGSSGGSSVLIEALAGGLGALVILLFVFGTLPAVLIPLVVAAAAILNTFTLVWALTYVTSVSIVVQFMIALVGLGVAVDYALLMIFRFRDELRAGRDVEQALAETVTHAGRSVIVSGSTVAVGLLSMLVLPVPFIRSIGIGGMLIPAVSVLAAITLLPALLAVLGERINSVHVLPKRLIDRGHPEDGAWGRWARFVLRRPRLIAFAGIVIVAALAALGTQLNPHEPQLRNIPGTGTGTGTAIASQLRTVPGIAGVSVPPTWRHGPDSLLEAFPAGDGSAPGAAATIDRVKIALAGGDGTLTGVAAVNQEFLHTLYANFPYLLAFVLVLTLLLLARAFRSIVLALKAVLLNLVSLAAAFGIVVFVFQQGHGSAIWSIGATQSITPWLPLMIFAFLYGLSMDYEVFMLTRIREAYDQTGSTHKAIELGLARTGKLVTSAALILMVAFLLLSTSPGYESKEFAIALAGGIIFDATVIRALLVPALMRLLGNANWWMPSWTHTILLLRRPASRPGLHPELAGRKA